MVQVKEAVTRAVNNFGDLFPEDRERGLRLEEVALTQDKKAWEVTVSFKNPDFDEEVANRKKGNNGIAYFSESTKVPARYYKTISIDAGDGMLMGIRNDWEVMNT